MGSTFTTFPGKYDQTSIFGTKKPMPVYLQFVPGAVIDVVTSHESAPHSSIRDINAIIAKPHISDTINTTAVVNQKYFPLLRGMVDTPCKGDQVLLCTFASVNYYLGPINTINNPNIVVDIFNVSESDKSRGKDKLARNKRDKLNISKNYPILPVSRLQKLYNNKLDDPDRKRKAYRDIHGDMTFEGRHGNSIRIGSRDVNPYIIFSNGRVPTNIVESTNDSTILAILDKGTIWQHFINDTKIIPPEGGAQGPPVIEPNPFVLASDKLLNEEEGEERKRFIGGELFDYEHENSQTLLSSGKITINSTINDSTISSRNNTIIGSGNTTQMVSENATIIEASNIYLGRQAEKQTEPVVLGNQLKEFLQEFLDLVGQTHALVQGIPIPVTDSMMKPLLPKVKLLAKKLKNPLFWSEYHFIEENGNKPE